MKFLGALPQVKEEDARFTIVLYGMGVLGATLYASYFFAKDANQVMYKDDARCPNFLDFLGYGILIGGGGITGLVLYIVAKTGTFLIYTQPEATEIRFSTSLLIALAGGMATQKVKGYLLSFAENVIKNTKNDQDGEQGRGGNG